MSSSVASLDKIVALCKRRGFVYQSAEIYGGLNGVYDFGPLGTILKNAIKNTWLEYMTSFDQDIVLLDGAILGGSEVWRASGHVDNFSDPMIDCLVCKKRYRADDIDCEKNCPACGNKQWTDVRQFNLMFQTQLGAMADASSIAYLRPETAQSIFINFKNVMSSTRVKIPFGIAQIGKAFRNEITPKQFLFRVREFEQMEMEFFCKPDQADAFFEQWVERRKSFFQLLGLNQMRLRARVHAVEELAHYAKACTDIEYEFPFGWKELEGIANRTNYDLSQHAKFSGKELNVFDEQTKAAYVPYVVECSVGVDRLFLTLLFDSYDEDVIEGETRTVLRFHPRVAPYTAAVMPLTNKLLDQSYVVYKQLKDAGLRVQYDDSGSIGKRYRRQDEIGTPVCFTYDFDSVNDGKVTARNRDTTQQERIAIDQLVPFLRDMLKK